jgi:mRNA degradation ribonuclease J1/J2
MATKLGRRIGLIGTYMTKAYEAMRKSFPGILRGDYKIFVMSKKNVKRGVQWLGDLQPKDYRKFVLLAEARMWQTYNTDFHQIMKTAAPLPQDEKHKACMPTDEELAKTGKLEIGKDDIVIFSTTDPYTEKMRICKMHVERHVKASKALFYPGLHISGHGQICDYRLLMEALKPKVVIPFHREKLDRDLLQKNVLGYLEPTPQFFNPQTNGTTFEWMT